MVKGQNMKMFLITTAFIISCSLVGRIHCQSSVETESVNENQHCFPNETECAPGCCPYPNGRCCEGHGCCETAQVCLPGFGWYPGPGVCLSIVEKDGQVSLTTKKSAPLRSFKLSCPEGTTECAPDKCCVYEDAVSCNDGEHCCPNGYMCDILGGTCIPDSATNQIDLDRPLPYRTLQRMQKKIPYKPCPGTDQMCPNHMSCCLNGKDEWSCCPNPSWRGPPIPESENRGGCCHVWFWGWTCCPDDKPACNFFGCV